MRAIGVGMLGAGFIGQMHSLTFGSLHRAKREPQLRARLAALADTNRALAEEVQRRYGWGTIAADWRSAVEHPDVRLFINSGPNDVHAEPSIAAATQGKHLFSPNPANRSPDRAGARGSLHHYATAERRPAPPAR
jgi:predicted dehydrogenase